MIVEILKELAALKRNFEGIRCFRLFTLWKHKNPFLREKKNGLGRFMNLTLQNLALRWLEVRETAHEEHDPMLMYSS